MSYRRLRAIFVKELHHITRDARSLAMALAMPMMMLLLYGYALSLDVDHIQTLVYDQDQTSESRAYLEELRGSTYFVEKALIANEADLDGSQINGIDIQEDHTFVRLPAGMPADVLERLQRVRVKGRPLAAGVVERRPPARRKPKPHRGQSR